MNAINTDGLGKQRYSALLCCYLGSNFGAIKKDENDERIFTTRDASYLVVTRAEQEHGIMQHSNGWFAHYSGRRWQYWQVVGGITVYRCMRLDNLLAS